MKLRILIPAGLLTLAVGLTACGGGHITPNAALSSSTTQASSQGSTQTTATTVATTVASTTAPVNYGAKFLAIIAPVNAAASTASAKIGALPASTTASAYVDAVAGYLQACEASIPKLLDVTWPGQAEADIHTLVAEIGAEDADMEAFATMNALNYSTVESQFIQDAGKAKTEGQVVRSDLGLPPAAN